MEWQLEGCGRDEPQGPTIAVDLSATLLPGSRGPNPPVLPLTGGYVTSAITVVGRPARPDDVVGDDGGMRSEFHAAAAVEDPWRSDGASTFGSSPGRPRARQTSVAIWTSTDCKTTGLSNDCLYCLNEALE